MTETLQILPAGRIAVLGPLRGPIERGLIARGFDVDRTPEASDDPMIALQASGASRRAAVVAMGVLPLLSASDLIRFCPRAAETLAPGGRLVVDGFQGSIDRLPQSLDVAVQRSMSPDLVRLLFAAAGVRGHKSAR